MNKSIEFERTLHTSSRSRIRRFFKRTVSCCIGGCRNKNAAVISDREMAYEKYSPTNTRFNTNESRQFRSYDTGSTEIVSRILKEKSQSLNKYVEQQEIDEVFNKRFKSKMNKLKNNIPEISEVRCPLCCIYFIKPVLLNCGHMFCNWCIKEHQSINDNTCPHCNEEIIGMIPSSVMQELVNNVIEGISCQAQNNFKLIEYSRAYLEEKIQLKQLRNKVLKTNGFKTVWI